MRLFGFSSLPNVRLPVAASVLAASAMPASAAFFFSEALPNTADDALLEYVVVASDSCVPESLSGYALSDASGKSFTFGPGDAFVSTGTLKIGRNVTKITLNNENESLFLRNPAWILVDTFSYATSVKGAPIFRVPEIPYPACFPTESFGVPENSGQSDGSEDSPTPDETLSEPEVVPEEGASVPGEGGAEESADSSSSTDSDGTGESEASEDPESETGATVPDSSETDPGTPALLSSAPSEDPLGSFENSTGSVSPEALSWASYAEGESLSAVPSLRTEGVSDIRATPEFLAVVDSDSDGRFDRLDIAYSESVTGTVTLSGIFLFSATGGLFESKVATATGFFRSASASGSVLSLSLSGPTLAKPSLRVDASTSSELRLKSTADFWLRTLASGLPVAPFALTTSFDAYSKDRVSFVPPPPPPPARVEYVAVPSGTSSTIPSVTSSEPASANISKASKPPKASKTAALGKAKVPAKNSAKAPSVGGPKPPKPAPTEKSAAPPKVAEGVAVVPSQGVDLLPDGTYRYECFSKTSCPVSLKVENAPKGGYWQFSDGRKRFGNSTGTLGKGFATYRLRYVAPSSGRDTEIPVLLSVVPAAEATAENVSSQAKAVSKALAASKSSATSSGTKKTSSGTASKTSKLPSSESKELSGSGAWAAVGSKKSPTLRPPGVEPSRDSFALALIAVSLVSLGLLAGGWIGSRLFPIPGEPVERA